MVGAKNKLYHFVNTFLNGKVFFRGHRMLLELGYVYHIKNEYFEFVKDDRLMQNHKNGGTRPNYLCIENSNKKLLWFVPMSSKVEKYKKQRQKFLDKYNRCDTIIIGKYRNKETAFLVQNIFPVTEKYIDHIDTVKGIAQPVAKNIQKEVINSVNNIFVLKSKGVNFIYPDVDTIAQKLLTEHKQEKNLNINIEDDFDDYNK